jgi:hypothetical protein
MVLAACIIAIVILDLLALRFGADSRDEFGDARRTGPGFWSNEGVDR